MKKLILITGILLSTSLWANPMDRICSFEGNYIGGFVGYKELEESCERNNIIEVKKIVLSTATFLVNSYCRFDRNVYIQERKQPSVNERVFYDLGCVLYAPEGRSRG